MRHASNINIGRSQEDVQKREGSQNKKQDTGSKHGVRAGCKRPQITADFLLQSAGWVSYWVDRFEKGGIDALRDLPRTGRPPKIEQKKINKIISSRPGNRTTPKMLRNDIRKKHHITYHITSVRRILKRMNMSVKRTQTVHANRASTKKIRSWQKRIKNKIPRLNREGFVTVIQDEAIYVSSSQM